LRMCFELLELMKLDVANHQLRTLRPFLMETALDFELTSFIDSAEKKRDSKSAWRITSTWLRSAVNRVKEPFQRSALVEQAVCDGLLDLIFKPPYPSNERRYRCKTVLPAPAASVVPETLQLDVFRLQAFHSDITDLAVVYAVLLLYRQLAGVARSTDTDLDRVRREVWALVASNPVMNCQVPSPGSMVINTANGPGLGLRKLESESWRKAMQDVLLQIAHRAHPDSTPDASTLKLLSSWADTNLRADAPLFVMLLNRLRSTLGELLLEHLEADCAGQGWWPQAAAAAAAAAVATSTVTASTNESGACGRTHPTVNVSISQMAKSTNGRKRRRDSISECEPELKRLCTLESVSSTNRNSDFEKSLIKNGLSPLEAEVRFLGERIAKVAGFHLRVYSQWYEKLLYGNSA